ncbi:hypothetical protein N0V83_003022 [Neocucurbitaria cava]|uniref:Uncharacterized protein n=1 Tax=Neocucurbitaria cava TaxID=798079 RepID=A0A9W9CP83_9PLEO|nr:hypothetical protein N0V83_003022 [Neocucurbitaria cava]
MNVTVDRNHPLPPISEAFASLRHQLESTWLKFEAAEHHLVSLDDAIDTEMLNYVSVHQKANIQQVWTERYRLTIQKYKPAIEAVIQRRSELESEVEALEKAAQRESGTLEAQAALKVDVGVMRRCLGITMEIVEAARAQLEQAKFMSLKL